MAKVTKEDLIESLAKVCCSKKEASDCLNSLIESIKKNLASGKDVVLTGFGTFSVSHRKARTGRNPQTGATIKIAAKKVPKFKSGKGLKDAVK
jgi:nucleoid DNA-binding protein